MTPELQLWTNSWKNEDDWNNGFHKALTERVAGDPILSQHREWVKANQFGFGDDPFHAVWHELVRSMPNDFAFLEIGVFKGQTISLVALCAKVMGKNATVFGVTTLSNTEDVRCRYPAGDYAAWIKQIHDQFQVPQPELIVGKSNDPKVIQAVQVHDYDLIYIDAGHDYRDVVSDIQNYAGHVRPDGFLIMDDSSINRLKVGSCWPGLEDVAKAVADHLDKDERFKFLFACGHLNVFQKVK